MALRSRPRRYMPAEVLFRMEWWMRFSAPGETRITAVTGLFIILCQSSLWKKIRNLSVGSTAPGERVWRLVGAGIPSGLASRGWKLPLGKQWIWKKRGWVKSDKKPALNPDLWDRLLALEEIHTLRYHWVKGHAENEYNNRCDELAVMESQKYK